MAEKFSIGHIGGKQGPGIVKATGVYTYRSEQSMGIAGVRTCVRPLNLLLYYSDRAQDVTRFPETGQGIEPTAILGPVNQGPEIELLTSLFPWLTFAL